MNRDWPFEIKKTRQREDVYQVLKDANHPLSAIEIYNLIEKTKGARNYAVSTIYRILSAFEEKNLVIKTSGIGEEKALYEWNYGNHMHYAVCLGCHKRIPIKNCPFEHEKIQTQDRDFCITGHKIEVFGYCKSCKNKLEKNFEKY